MFVLVVLHPDVWRNLRTRVKGVCCCVMKPLCLSVGPFEGRRFKFLVGGMGLVFSSTCVLFI